MYCRSCSRSMPPASDNICDYFYVKHTYASEIMSRNGLSVFEEAKKDEEMCNVVPCYTSVCHLCYCTCLLFECGPVRTHNTDEIIRLVAYKRQLEVVFICPFRVCS